MIQGTVTVSGGVSTTSGDLAMMPVTRNLLLGAVSDVGEFVVTRPVVSNAAASNIVMRGQDVSTPGFQAGSL